MKALYRRGLARINLGLIVDARRDFERILEIEPANIDATKELNAIERLLVCRIVHF